MNTTPTQQNQTIDAQLVQRIAGDVVDSKLRDMQYQVADIQNHAHTGTDSPQISFSSLVSAPNYRVIRGVTLTSAQIKLLHTTPIVLAPAPGVRSFCIVEGIEAYLNYNGTAYTGANALEFRYTDGTGAKVSADISTTFLNGAASKYSHVAGVATELVPVINAAVVVAVPTANPATGNSPITFQITYRVVSFS